MKVAPEPRMKKEVVAMGSSMNKRRHKRGNAEAKATAPPKVLRKDYAFVHPGQSTRRGKSLTAMKFKVGTPVVALTTQETPIGTKGVIDPDPLSYAKPRPALERDVAQASKKAPVAEDPESEKSTSFTSMVGSPGSIYQPGWGVTNSCRLDTPDVCQDVVDHIVPPGYFSELRHLPNDAFLNQYNINLARQAREEEIKRLDQEIVSLKFVKVEVQGLRDQLKNLGTLLEVEVDMRNAAEAKNTELAKELDSLRAKFSNLQVNNNQLSQQVTTLEAQVTGEERIKAAFEEFKRYEDDKV
ncbi:hypothetical protein Tco_1424234 [Tanacetum coccineum]